MAKSHSRAQRTRAIAAPDTNIGKRRHGLYRAAHQRINEAIAAGFYLEAITLVESLIADRLESRASFLLSEDFSFKTLERLIGKLRDEEQDSRLRKLIEGELEHWKEGRNKALHEMAKIADGDTSSWAERMESLGPIAKSGQTLLRKLDKRCMQLRRQ